jgi:hypothetical protein
LNATAARDAFGVAGGFVLVIQTVNQRSVFL